jgi:protein-tyrosine-phosphatase
VTQTILFLCPHAAAKSVLAMTYFNDLAIRAGLDVAVDNAGTEPDPAINLGVAAFLLDEGFDLTGFVPSLLTD